MDSGLQTLQKNLAEAFNIKEVDKRLKERQGQATAPVAQEEAPVAVPVDLYRTKTNKTFENSKKKFPNGSTALVKAVVKAIITGDGGPQGLARAFRRANEDIELYKSRGEGDRAEIAKQQYMEEKFLPAVETVIRYTSPDELLNSKEALSSLDDYAIGTGKMSGYTASYVKSAYGNVLGEDLESRFGESDASVRDAVRRIVALSDEGEIRVAVGIARKIKKQIDNGDHMASDDDYALIGRVVAYAD